MMRPFIPLALATNLAGGLRLGTQVTSKEQPKPTPPTKEEVEASDTCECLFTDITSSSDYLTPVGYYGSSCGIWDKFTGMPYFSSACGSCASKSCENAHCQKAWCYVSHTCDKLEVEASDVFSGLYWSYFACQSPASNKGHVLATYVKEAVEVYAHLSTQEDDIDKLCKTELKFEKLKEYWEEMCDMADESERVHGMWGTCELVLGDLTEEGDKEACAEARKQFNFDLAYLSGFEKITRHTLQIMIRVLEEMQGDVDGDKEFEDWSKNLKDEEFNDALAFYHKANFPLASEEWLTQQAKEDDISPELLDITLKIFLKMDYRKQESAAYTAVEKELYEDYQQYLKGLDEKIDLAAEQKYLETLVLDLSDKLMDELKESLNAKKPSVVGSIEVPIPEKKKPKIQDPIELLKEKKMLKDRVHKALKDLKDTATSKKVEVMKIEGKKLKDERKVPAKSPDKAERIAKIEKKAKEEEAALDLDEEKKPTPEISIEDLDDPSNVNSDTDEGPTINKLNDAIKKLPLPDLTKTPKIKIEDLDDSSKTNTMINKPLDTTKELELPVPDLTKTTKIIEDLDDASKRNTMINKPLDTIKEQELPVPDLMKTTKIIEDSDDLSNVNSDADEGPTMINKLNDAIKKPPLPDLTKTTKIIEDLDDASKRNTLINKPLDTIKEQELPVPDLTKTTKIIEDLDESSKVNSGADEGRSYTPLDTIQEVNEEEEEDSYDLKEAERLKEKEKEAARKEKEAKEAADELAKEELKKEAERKKAEEEAQAAIDKAEKKKKEAAAKKLKEDEARLEEERLAKLKEAEELAAQEEALKEAAKKAKPDFQVKDCKTGLREKSFLGGYKEMAQWMASKNVGEPCDIGNSGYNAKRGKGADRTDNRKYGFNRSGVREYCEQNKFNFRVQSKADAYKWCCIYGDAIEARLSDINKSKCNTEGYQPI